MEAAPPMDRVDWSIPVDDSAMHRPAECLPLHGTPAWEAMSEPRRREYSRHEAAAFLGSGIWFENILMHALARHAYSLPADDPAHRFLLRELADECRHSTAFGAFIRKAGTPAYRPSAWLRFQGKIIKLVLNTPAYYLIILAGEEISEGFFRPIAADPASHPVIRAISAAHLVEEQPHLSWARRWLSETWPRLGPVARWYARWWTPVVVYTIVQSLVNPRLHETLGIADGWRQAWTNPRFWERTRGDLAGYARFCESLGVIDGRVRWLWRALGLV